MSKLASVVLYRPTAAAQIVAEALRIPVPDASWFRSSRIKKLIEPVKDPALGLAYRSDDLERLILTLLDTDRLLTLEEAVVFLRETLKVKVTRRSVNNWVIRGVMTEGGGRVTLPSSTVVIRGVSQRVVHPQELRRFVSQPPNSGSKGRPRKAALTR